MPICFSELIKLPKPMFPPKNEWIRHPMFHDSDVTNFLLKGNLSTIMANKFNESNELKLCIDCNHLLINHKRIQYEPDDPSKKPIIVIYCDEEECNCEDIIM